MSRKIQNGEAIEFTNGTGGSLSAGSMAAVGPVVGVVHEDTANSAVGVIKISGIYDLDKADAASITVGDKVVWDASTNSVQANGFTTATGDVTDFGVAMETLGTTTNARVKVLLCPGEGAVA